MVVTFTQRCASFRDNIVPYSWFFSRYLNSAVFADMERSVKFKSLKNHFVYSIYGAAEMIRENKNAKN